MPNKCIGMTHFICTYIFTFSNLQRGRLILLKDRTRTRDDTSGETVELEPRKTIYIRDLIKKELVSIGKDGVLEYVLLFPYT